ncbi:MAG: hypothetical protein GF384_01150 [Elusimicrobia bacterium]|nr:hypothetical protein [Elusimicrobiota bacterium]MBD3411644.1 hypothetical protein [Elusimicrobiota bacterium]
MSKYKYYMHPCSWLMIMLVLIPLAVANARQSDSREPFLYPGGFPSARVLNKNEKLLAANGWLSYGLTERMTVTLDWLLVFVAVPAGYIRYRLPDTTERWHHALEIYGLSFAAYGKVKTIETDEFTVRQKGGQAWLHWNSTYDITSIFSVHGLLGYTYDTYQLYEPKQDANFSGDKEYTDYFQFDGGAGIEWKAARWAVVSINYIHGNTFYVYDQNPQKWIVQYSIQCAPFLSWRHGFFRNMRIEFSGFYVRFPELDFSEGYPPLYPLVMWQW